MRYARGRNGPSRGGKDAKDTDPPAATEDKEPTAKGDEPEPAARVRGESEDGPAARHAEELANLHKQHESERRDLHGQHRREHRDLAKRHEKEMTAMGAEGKE